MWPLSRSLTRSPIWAINSQEEIPHKPSAHAKCHRKKISACPLIYLFPFLLREGSLLLFIYLFILTGANLRRAHIQCCCSLPAGRWTKSSEGLFFCLFEKIWGHLPEEFLHDVCSYSATKCLFWICFITAAFVSFTIKGLTKNMPWSVSHGGLGGCLLSYRYSREKKVGFVSFLLKSYTNKL